MELISEHGKIRFLHKPYFFRLESRVHCLDYPIRVPFDSESTKTIKA